MWLLLPVCLLSLTLALIMRDWSTPLNKADEEGGVEMCGYTVSCEECKPGAINVHIVAHTHNDVGWIKTVEEYYSGTRGIKKGTVRSILDSVVKELWADPRRRFTYVESYFFFKWWNHQNDTVKQKVHTLVQEGRLQFAGGAWSMNDEASTHYQSIIDQFTFGLRHLNDTFGECGMPTVGWQIDPFGHSREFVSLLAGMGFEGVFFGRIDYQDRANRMKKKTMEMVWRGDDSLGESSDLFAGILYNLYHPPPGFCFDKYCYATTKIDKKKVSLFLRHVEHMSSAYLTKNLLLTMGGDFHYENASAWFSNLDKLIELANLRAKQNIKVFYSTPHCYLKAVKDENPALPTKRDDFFPYAHYANGYWTGYFTSRPTAKYFEREANRYLQMAKQLQVLGGMETRNLPALNELSSAMGIMQHHDAITGTAKQYVVHDYERILDTAIEGSLDIPRQSFNKFMRGVAAPDPGDILSHDRCRLNESSCAASEGSNQFVVTLYNPLAWNVKEPVRIPVQKGNFEVYSPIGDKIASQLVDIPPQILDIPTRKSKATHEIIFIAYLQPVSFKAFYVKKIPYDDDDRNVIQVIKKKIRKRSVESVNKKVLFKDNDTNIDDKATFIPLTDKTKDTNEDSNLKINFTMVVYDTTAFNKFIDDMTTLLPNEAEDINDDDYLKNDNATVATENIENTVDTITPLSTADKLNETKDTNDDDYVINDDVTVATDTNKYIDDTNTPLSTADKLNEIKDTNDDDYLKNDNATVATSTNKPSPMPLLGEAHPRVKKPLRQSDVPAIHMENQHMKIDINPRNQIIDTTLADGNEVMFKVKFYSYDSIYSGAYIFRPNKTTATKIGQKVTRTIVGDVVNEIRIDTQENKFSVIRIYDGLDYIENDWVVGPINNTIMGKEIVVRYNTDILSNGDFYTDSNGRQMLKRKLGYRPQWNVTIAEPISGNYYPIVNKISIQDDKVKFTLITDRAEGGTSLKEGQLEVMVHRRLVRDDQLGVDEVLNETDVKGIGLVVRGRHRIFLSRTGNGEDDIVEKKNVLQVDSQPLVFVSDAMNLGLQEWLKFKNEYSWANALPTGVHLLTLEHWKDNQILLRLENYLELSDRRNSVIEVDLQSIFKTIRLTSFRETTLAANNWLELEEEPHRESWLEYISGFWRTQNFKPFKIKLKAKQIRTFVIDSWTWSYPLPNIRIIYPFTSSPPDSVSSLSGVVSWLVSASKSTLLCCLCCQFLIHFFVHV